MTDERARGDPLICLIAGEPSGDLLGARLMAALRRETGGRVRFMGVGGEAMRAQGLETLADISELAVMGFAEVVPRLLTILRHVEAVTAAIERARPDAVATIDSWGFSERVQRFVQRRFPEILRVHYVAPMVWAWKKRRAKTVAQRVQHLLCLLPREPVFFSRYGLSTTHVGHPVVEGGARAGDGARFRRMYGVPEDAPLLCLLPGSRQGEVSRLLPVFGQMLALAAERAPSLWVAAPTVSTVRERVKRAAKDWPVPAVVVEGEEARYDAFAACRAALAASGTVSLELALAGTPHAVAYKVSALTAAIFRRMATLRYVNLVNLLLDRPVVPELLQEDCRAERLAAAVERLMEDEALRAAQREAFKESLRCLGGEGESPSVKAARVILGLLKERKRQS